MNKTLSIALAGFSFVIDEHAYIKLSDYLQALRGSLDADEADEVMHDIEIRMVEIFKDSLGKREVINDIDVEKVIAQIGTPEQIDEQEEAYYSESKPKNKSTFSGYNKNDQKQLFRDPGQQKIAGVCAGLAAYFNMDITWMRLIWIGAFLFLWIAPGSSFLVVLLYGILWMVLPQAASASDYLKMKGKPLNFDNLKEESSKIVQFANDSTQRVGEFYNENKPQISQASGTVWNILKYTFAVLVSLMAAGSFIGLFVMIAAFNLGKFNVDDNLGFYLEENNLGYLLLFIAGIPVVIVGVAFLLLAIKLFSPKTKFNYIGKVLGTFGIIWIILVGIFAYSASNISMRSEGYNEDSENIAINTTSDSLIIESNKINIPSNFKNYWDNVYSDKKVIYKKDYPSVDVIRKDGIKMPYILIKKEANGYNQPIKIRVPVQVVNNKIMFPNYISYPYDHRFRNYRINYELFVPRDMTIVKNNNYDVLVRDDADNNELDDIDDDFDYDKHNQGIKIEKNKIKINGTTIEYSSDDKDHVIINGKKVDSDSAEIMLKKMKISDTDIKNLDISVKDGKNEVSIKAK
ncbi:PspC domain-containing protein [Chryseobacterium sp. T1]